MADTPFKVLKDFELLEQFYEEIVQFTDTTEYTKSLY